jgi:hypothetical protein
MQSLVQTNTENMDLVVNLYFVNSRYKCRKTYQNLNPQNCRSYLNSSNSESPMSRQKLISNFQANARKVDPYLIKIPTSDQL